MPELKWARDQGDDPQQQQPRGREG